MKGRINIVVVSTGIGGVLNFKVFNENEVLNDLNCLDFAVAVEELANFFLSGLVHA